MSQKALCNELLVALGGADNIFVATHCATRLRLTIRDENKVLEDQVTAISGVLGLVRNQNEYQVIIGPGVETVYQEFIKLGEFEKARPAEENKSASTDEDKKNPFLTATDFIAGAVLPTLPVIVAGGMIDQVIGKGKLLIYNIRQLPDGNTFFFFIPKQFPYGNRVVVITIRNHPLRYFRRRMRFIIRQDSDFVISQNKRFIQFRPRASCKRYDMHILIRHQQTMSEQLQ